MNSKNKNTTINICGNENNNRNDNKRHHKHF